MASNAACMIPYPERYYKAVEFVEHPSNAEAVRDDALLLLYALNQQATVGPCNEPKPWSWNVVETAKWQSWRSLAGMSKMEAMRLFVRTLEEEQADWWKKPLEVTSCLGSSCLGWEPDGGFHSTG